jgi:Protein of unknown function (DUF1553)/Protein of unknown function (DUF1549)/Bacterial Ig-like domain (group 2)
MPRRSFGLVLLTCTLVTAGAMPPARLRADTPKLPVAQAPAAPVQGLTVFPSAITLDGPRAEQRLGVLALHADGRQWDHSRSAAFASSDPKVATVDATGTVRPAGDGRATVTVTAAGRIVTVPVTVTRSAAEDPVGFTREIETVLTKAGCNQGACHGAQLGRGGFRLSLLGFDPAFDHAQIVQSAEGRRVVLPEPERSILLLKPSLAMEHGGGERLKATSAGYDLVRRWLADGAPEPAPTDPHVARLEVWPLKRRMVPGESQQLAVRAHWSDGRVQDVTSWAQFDAVHDAIAGVSPAGLVTAKAAGEGHVMVRFAGQAVTAQVTLPYARLTDYPQVARHNFIDDLLVAKWRDLGLTPSPLCDDATFLRRVYLDGIGTLPTPEEVKAFLADKSPDKRAKAIDAVLGRPEFVDFWAVKWGDLLRINRDALQEKGMWSFHNWVRASLRDGKPMDQFAREILLAEGSTFTEGPANFYKIGRTAEDWAETAAQVFLGARIQCAKCHHHPFEKWSQDDYYGLAAFFTRLGTKTSNEFGIFGRETVIFPKPAGEITHPRTRGVVKPRPLGGEPTDDEFDRRRKLADWMTGPDNPLFARNLVNRFWGYLMGRGLVEPLDDLRDTNPACAPELLDALAKDLAAHNFDLKHLLRTVMRSRAYQLDDHAAPGNEADATNTYFTRYQTKRLSAEQLADAVDFATGTRQKYQGLPAGTRAIQLPDPRVASYLMDVFGRPQRVITCECERTTQPNIAQALHLLNGDFLNKKIADPAGRVERLMKVKAPVPAVVEELYLVTLSRPPRPDEGAKAQEWFREGPPKEVAQDLLWSLLNSREFLFNH